MARKTLLLSLSIALSLSHLTAGQNATDQCPNSRAYQSNYSIRTANATGVYKIPGLWQDSNGEPGFARNSSQAWTLTQTLVRDSANRNITVLNSYLTMPSAGNYSVRSQFVTCARVFQVPDDVALASQADEGSCSMVFGADCLRDLKDLHQRQATAYAREEHSYNTFCSGFWDTVKIDDYPASCGNSTAKIFKGGQALMTISTDNSPTSGTCPNPIFVEFFDTHSWDALGATDAMRAVSPDPFDFSAYDAAWQSIRPFFLVRIGNATTTANDGFADVQMVCARPKMVSEGSRLPSTRASSSSATVLKVSSWIVGLAAALTGVTAVL